ncbi:hypothetical protein KBTX_01650 [wastewater metagenome]|uniref:Uncharacterized protein n=2 Tax=unclassified sequences TaxID=12908 RepID=A0A5B8R9C4_9ZZZZ|nr:hypothetical protein [Arhodomonas sp. KWT]QEA05330.1 hypothetical protein KBTEX_01650 [uncultured organism]
MLLRIDSNEAWPKSIIERIDAHQGLLRSAKYMENLIESQPFRAIAEDLEGFIRENRILAYHCTKEAETGFFLRNGLRILNRTQHQAEFLNRYGYLFSPAELQHMHQEWETYFAGAQDNGRNGSLWFCLAPNQVVSDGTERLFRCFGGEAIYMPLTHHAAITSKLEAIGSPVVVEVSIDPNQLHTFCELTFALKALSILHRKRNSDAYFHSQEGYLTCNVSPHEIVRVIPKEAFFSAHAEWWSS